MTDLTPAERAAAEALDFQGTYKVEADPPFKPVLRSPSELARIAVRAAEPVWERAQHLLVCSKGIGPIGDCPVCSPNALWTRVEKAEKEAADLRAAWEEENKRRLDAEDDRDFLRAVALWLYDHADMGKRGQPWDTCPDGHQMPEEFREAARLLLREKAE